MEESGLYSVSILTHLLAELAKTLPQWASIHTVKLWFDQGTHFRCNRMLGATGLLWPERWHKSFSVNFGPPAHLKEDCDRFFSVLDERLRKAAPNDIVEEIPQVLDLWRENLPSYEEHYVDYMPQDKAVIYPPLFERSSLPCGICSTYHWHSQMADARRKH